MINIFKKETDKTPPANWPFRMWNGQLVKNPKPKAKPMEFTAPF